MGRRFLACKAGISDHVPKLLVGLVRVGDEPVRYTLVVQLAECQ